LETDPSVDNKRYEIKLVYDGLQIDKVSSWIHTHPFLFRKEYPPRQVNNIYFDTVEMNLRTDHIQGIFSRYKLRYRWYHDTWTIKNGILECKQKSGNLGKKESYQLKGNIDLTVLNWKQIQEKINLELPPDWKIIFNATQPILINSYFREYYIDAERKIRITLDARQRTYNQGFSHKPNLTTETPMRNIMVLEIKAGKANYREIADVLAAFPLYSTAHSKYLEGTENIV
jgi:SPX domain protein involved in polyphosphate accumulation